MRRLGREFLAELRYELGGVGPELAVMAAALTLWISLLVGWVDPAQAGPGGSKWRWHQEPVRTAPADDCSGNRCH